MTKLILERRGYEAMDAIRLIKADEKMRHIAVVYFTSRLDVKEFAAEAGADG